MPDTEAVIRARKFLAGERLKFAQVDTLWKDLKKQDAARLSEARNQAKLDRIGAILEDDWN